MKKILSILTIAVVIASCSQNPQKLDANATKVTAADTAGLADFQAWKSQNELAEYNAYMKSQYAPASKAPATHTHARTTRNSGNMSSQSSNTAKAPARKKGWSKAAKGAAIGAGTGAIAGAVINKRNRGAGAVIGGVVGGAGGYVIGRSMDKKDGRY